MKHHLCCDYGLMPEKRREGGRYVCGGGGSGVWTGIPRKVWWFTWATPVTVIATPSAVSTSSHLGCRVIISSVILWRMWTNIEKKLTCSEGKQMKGRASNTSKQQDKVKPFTQGLQITNNGAKWDAIQNLSLVGFKFLPDCFQMQLFLKFVFCQFCSRHLLTPLWKVTQSSALWRS